MHLGRDFRAQTIQPDEAGGVVLIVGLGRVGFHRGIQLYSNSGGKSLAPCNTRTTSIPFSIER